MSSRLILALSIFALYLLWSATSFAQSGNPISIGKSFTIHSQALNEERPYWVHIPKEHQGSGEKLSVMYLLDGESHFHHTAGIVSFLAQQRRIPPMMLVAIPNTTDRTRDLTPAIQKDSSDRVGFSNAGGAGNMLRFIRDELIPQIDQAYHTNAYRLLVGHSFGGIFSLLTLMEAPELFDAHISISPSMWWDDQRLVEQAETFLRERDTLDAFYYMTMGNEGGSMLAGAMKLAALFEEHAPVDFQWDFKVMEDESHGSVPHRSTYDGLEAIFREWSTTNLETLYASGGLEKVKDYYRRLSAKFGHDLAPTESDLNSLGYDFMGRGAYGTALEIFQENMRRFPESYNVYDSAAEAFMKMGERDIAIRLYRKSLEINPGSENGVKMLKKLDVFHDPLASVIPLRPKQLQIYVGSYENETIGDIEIYLSEDQLKWRGAGLPEQSLHPLPSHRFLMMPAHISVSFSFEEGDVVSLRAQTGVTTALTAERKP